MSSGAVFTAAELAALAGLPSLAICLYMIAIRPRMDFRTGRVGDRPRISWHALTEWLYVEPHPGIAGGSPGIQQVRRAARWLEKAGLVEMHSSEVHRILVFSLPLARVSFHVQKKADSKPTDQADRPAQREKPAKADRSKQGKADTHRQSAVPTNKQSHTTTTVLRGWEQLQWPSSATPEEKARWETLIRRANLNGDAQLVLDELAGAISKSAIQNKDGYLRALLRNHKAGSFVAERAYAVADARERARTTQERITQARQGHTTDPATMAAGRAVLDNIRKRRHVA